MRSEFKQNVSTSGEYRIGQSVRIQSREEVMPNTFEGVFEAGNHLEDLDLGREHFLEKHLRILMTYAGVFALDLGLAEGRERLIADEDAQTGAGGNRRYGDGPRSSGFCATEPSIIR